MFSQVINLLIANMSPSRRQQMEQLHQDQLNGIRRRPRRGTRLLSYPTSTTMTNSNNYPSKRLLVADTTTASIVGIDSNYDGNSSSNKINRNSHHRRTNTNISSSSSPPPTSSPVSTSSTNCSTKTQPLYQTSRYSSSTSTSTLFCLSFMFILAIEIFSHQLLVIPSCTATTATGSSTDFQDIGVQRVIRGGNSNRNKNRPPNNMLTMTNNKVFHHIRTPVTIPPSTTTTGRSSGKGKFPVKGSSTKTKDKMTKAKPSKKKPGNAQSIKIRPIFNSNNNNAAGRFNQSNSDLWKPNFSPGQNRPLYMKKPPPPVPTGEENNFYLSTKQISSSTTSLPLPVKDVSNLPLPLPIKMEWTPSAPDLGSWHETNRPNYPGGRPHHQNHNYNSPFSFSTTTSRSMSILPPPPSFQFQKQPQLDPLSILKTEMETTTGKETTTKTSKGKDGGGDGDDDDDDDGNLLGRSNIDFGRVRSPIYERTTEKLTSTTTGGNHSGISIIGGGSEATSGKKLVSNFFDNFEDHWDDPIADESQGSQSVMQIVDPPKELKNYTAVGEGNSNTPGNNKGQKVQASGDYLTTVVGGTGPSAPEHGYLNPPTLQNYPPHYHFMPGSINSNNNNEPFRNSYFSSHKNVNYWPSKLNSYYGEHVSSQLAQHHHPLTIPSVPPPPPPVPVQQHLGHKRRPFPPRHRFRPAGRRPPHSPGIVRPRIPILNESKNSPLPPPPSQIINPNLKLQNSFPFQFMKEPPGSHHPAAHHLLNQQPPTGPSLLLNSLEEDIIGITGGGSTTATAAVAGTGVTGGSDLGQDLFTSESNQKVNMIDRVSTFYSEYKLLAWAGILILISLAVLGGLIALYMNNPPTEVVTAKRDLVSRLTEPRLMRFLEHLIEGDGGGGGDENGTSFMSSILSIGDEIVKMKTPDASSENSKVKTRRKRSKLD